MDNKYVKSQRTLIALPRSKRRRTGGISGSWSGSMTGMAGGMNESQARDLIKQLGSTMFLSRILDDIAKGLITFEQGIKIGEGDDSAKLSFDKVNRALRIDGTVYATGDMIALGTVNLDEGATVNVTLGQLLNVTDTADNIHSVDKVLVRLAGSSQWTLKNLSELGGGLDESQLLAFLNRNKYVTESQLPDLSEYLKVEKFYGLWAGLEEEFDSFRLGVVNNFLNLSGGTMRNTNLVTNLNADLLDGRHSTGFAWFSWFGASHSLDTLQGESGIASVSSNDAAKGCNAPIGEAGTLFYGVSAYNATNQIYGSFTSNRWFARGGGNGASATSHTPWREFAFLDSTVANASNLGGIAASDYVYNFNSSLTGSISSVPPKTVFSALGSNLTDPPAGLSTWLSGFMFASNWNTNIVYKMPLVSCATQRRFYTTTFNSTGTTTGWLTFAYLSDNVASATKLQTSRNLWGQPFDGTGAVNGPLEMSGMSFHIAYASYDGWSDGVETRPWYGISYRISQSRGVYSAAMASYGGLTLKTASGEVCLTSTGYLGVGISNPTAKLHVAGNIMATGEVIALA